MNVKVFNLAQQVLGLIGRRPLLCHNDGFLCPGCEPGQVFECSRCHRLMPWCMGAADTFQDWCDDCVSEYSKQEGFPDTL